MKRVHNCHTTYNILSAVSLQFMCNHLPFLWKPSETGNKCVQISKFTISNSYSLTLEYTQTRTHRRDVLFVFLPRSFSGLPTISRPVYPFFKCRKEFLIRDIFVLFTFAYRLYNMETKLQYFDIYSYKKNETVDGNDKYSYVV